MNTKQANKKINIMLLVFFLFSLNLVFAETYEKRQLFFTGQNSFFDADLKISTTGVKLKDNNNNILQEGDYVCDFSKYSLVGDNFYEDANGEWYFNGGQTSSPPIIWDEEKVKEVREKVSTNLNLNYGQNVYGGFIDTTKTFSGWNFPSLVVSIDTVEIENTTGSFGPVRGAVVCANENKGIACFALGVRSLDGLRYIFAPNGSYSYEWYVFEKHVSGEALRALASQINFQTVGSNPTYDLIIRDLKLDLLDKIVLSFKLENDGEVPLRIKNIRVLFNNKELSFVDVLNIINVEVDVDSNKEVVLELEKFFDNPCDLLNKDVKVVVEYDAPRFKCDYQIFGSVEDKISITEDYKTNYELKIINPQDDFYVYSSNAGKNFNNRIDLHVGNDNGILRSYIYQDISKINTTNLLKALLVVNVMELKGSNNEIVFYEIPNSFNPSSIKWSVQPKIGEKIETKIIEKTGLITIDITEYVKKKKGFGFAIRAFDESINADTIINALESEQKPQIKLYYKSTKTLKEQCTTL